MILRMKNFNILEVHWKIQLFFLGGGGEPIHEKPIQRGDCLKRGTWTVCQFKGGLGKKEGGGVFEGGTLIPQCTLWTFIWSRKGIPSLLLFTGRLVQVSKSISIKGIQIFSILYQLQFYEAKNTWRQKYLQR